MRETPAPTVDARETPDSGPIDPVDFFADLAGANDRLLQSLHQVDPESASRISAIIAEDPILPPHHIAAPPVPPASTLRQRARPRQSTKVRIEQTVRNKLVIPAQLWVSDNAFRRNDMSFHLSQHQCRYGRTVQTLRPIRFCPTCFHERTGTLVEDIIEQATANHAVITFDDPVEVVEWTESNGLHEGTVDQTA